MAAYQSMIHSLVITSLTEERFKDELNYIKDTVENNGFSRNEISRILRRKKQRLQKEQLSTQFQQVSNQQPLRACVTHSAMTGTIKNILEKQNIAVVSSNRNQQLRAKLGSSKDSLEKSEKCGMYKVSCPECLKVYIGQTMCGNSRSGKNDDGRNINSMVARHMAEEKHNIDIANVEALIILAALCAAGASLKPPNQINLSTEGPSLIEAVPNQNFSVDNIHDGPRTNLENLVVSLCKDSSDCGKNYSDEKADTNVTVLNDFKPVAPMNHSSVLSNIKSNEGESNITEQGSTKGVVKMKLNVNVEELQMKKTNDSNEIKPKGSQIYSRLVHPISVAELFSRRGKTAL